MTLRWYAARHRRAIAATLVTVALVVGGRPVRTAGVQPPEDPPLQLSSAVPDADGQSLIITGTNFGRRPLVTLELLPVTVRYSLGATLVVAVPVSQMPPGTYLLTVSRGATPAENASLSVTLGSTPSPSATTAPSAGTELIPSGAAVAATVGDRSITLADVDREWQRTDPAGYLAASRDLYSQRRRVVDQMVTDDLIAREAAARGTTSAALLAEEIPKRTITMPETVVVALYQSMSDRTRGATLDQMRPALRAWLERHAEPELAKMNYVEELMKVSTRAEVLLEAPRVDVALGDGDPALGPPSAPVVIVAFGDFDSLDYTRLAGAFAWVRDTFGDRVRLVFKDLPTMGPESVAIAEAAACAHRQGKFWPFHDAVVKRFGPLDTARLQQLASDAGMVRQDFDRCVSDRVTAPTIVEALRQASRYAIVSSPSFLVNGRLVPSPPAFLPPNEFFTRIIEEELKRQTRAAAGRR